MGEPFRKSWSVYGHRQIDNGRRDPNFHRIGSERHTKINLQRRFGDENSVVDSCVNVNARLGLKLRSLTDSNIRQLGVHGLSSGYNQLDSPRSFRRPPLLQLPERFGSFWNSIEESACEVGPKAENFFQKGGQKFTKALEGVRTSMRTISQRFKRTTRRRYKLDNTPTRTPVRTHQQHPPLITPGKLYSPFDVNTPRTPHSYMKEPKRLQQQQQHANRRRFHGNENFGLCSTPPQPHFKVPNESVQTNWVPFNSPHHHHYLHHPHEHREESRRRRYTGNNSSYNQAMSVGQEPSFHTTHLYWR